ncbi:duplicated orphan permease [Chitinophaga terrae (ex Kim and Jung 2007)]|uniref:Duplicated orphan permease n=1 Tax=Chitinophaga terrae (ex Kim and Jung 2007) TaxID=408074 RepID=A0A1H4FNY0_9BACT|nr:ABC transporter permease [Chitinophaga terrae (ex Kim and Jung 2007)]GEP89074.1 ABC transporter permease [Chitinophaga terrae (ex Kim and Jung 2007)]SEA98530.1 duplicated orphan permease [Chitinophaga terrae (ex Kim and Jung 2007)]
MIKNYLLIAFRSLRKNRFFTLVNVLGLAFGLTVCMLIVCWVMDEYSVDKFNKNGHKLYRLHANEHWGGMQTLATTPIAMADRLYPKYPEIETVVRVMDGGSLALFKTPAYTEKTASYAYASPNFLEYFDYPLLYGDRQTALKNPEAVLISKEMAIKFYGKVNAVGEALQLEDGASLLVTGILDDMPNASRKFDVLQTLAFNVKQNPWLMRPGSFSVSQYLVLREGTDLKAFTAKIQQEAVVSGGQKEELWLQPFEDIYLHGRYDNGKVVGGRIEYVRLFLITALIVLVIACINFMNLSTAQASKRGKEVGVRKSLGAPRTSLVLQFAGEAMIMTLIAALLACAAIACLIPFFSDLTGKSLSFSGTNISKYLLVLLLVTIVTGLIAGSYPAFALSRFAPVRVLKGDTKATGGNLFRKNLVVLQFVLSFGFIVGSIGVYCQTQYIYSRNLGMDRENIVYIQQDKGSRENMDAIDQALRQLPQVKSLTYSSWLPIALESTSADLDWEGRPDKLVLSTSPLRVSYDFLSTMGIELAQGRDFSRKFSSDSAAYIINESAARMMNMKDPLGKYISFWQGKGEIIGVVKDFHFNSMHKEIGPMVMMLSPFASDYIMIKLHKGATAAGVAGIQNVFKTLNPGYPMNYHFLDEEFDRLYSSETMLKRLAAVFAAIAIFISCLGLLGLSVYTAEQRKKEICIRKVLGASVTEVTTTLSKEYLKPVLIAIVIATPISWYVLHSWLNSYAYHISLTAWMFIGAAVIAIVIAVATVSVQSIRAARTNPVKYLKSE